MYSNNFRENVTYVVQDGDSLYSIANKFNTTVSSLMYLNNLTNTVLNTGQVLVISFNGDDAEVPVYDSYEEFISENKGNGILKIHVYTARGTYPIKDAYVIVSKIIGQKKFIFFQGKTNESGIVNQINLPTMVLDEDSPQKTIYLVESTHSNYKQKSSQTVSIYDGIKSILNIEMIPVGGNL